MAVRRRMIVHHGRDRLNLRGAGAAVLLGLLCVGAFLAFRLGIFFRDRLCLGRRCCGLVGRLTEAVAAFGVALGGAGDGLGVSSCLTDATSMDFGGSGCDWNSAPMPMLPASDREAKHQNQPLLKLLPNPSTHDCHSRFDALSPILGQNDASIEAFEYPSASGQALQLLRAIDFVVPSMSKSQADANPKAFQR